MVELTFITPSYLWLLLLIPILVLTHFYGLREGKRKALRFANFEALERVTGGHKLSLNLPLLFLRFFTLLFLILALAAPIFWYEGQAGDFSYVVAIDVSGSMLADDFSPNRLESAKRAALEFVERIPTSSKLGVVSFSGTSFLQSTLTEDKQQMRDAINAVKIEHASGTAVGDAIIASSNTLMEEQENGRVLVVLTDGQSNTGTVVEKAINYANDRFVTINTIGVGTEQGGRFAEVSAISTIDSSSLQSIAKNSGGSFYHAQDDEELVAAYDDIAKNSNKKIPIRLALWFTILTFVTLSIEWVIINTRFRSVP